MITEADEHTPQIANVQATRISRRTHGMFKYAPECCRNVFLSPGGLLFFLSWGFAVQVA